MIPTDLPERPAAAEPESFEAYRSYLFAIAYRMLGSAMDAEDMIGQLHLAHRNRETYLGPWLPEPIPTATGEDRLVTDETLSVAFMVLLEQLHPIERAVFLLREVFDYDYPDIAAFLDKSEAACRQAFSRAKKHLTEHRPRFHTSPETQRQLLGRFLEGAQAGEMAGLMDLLSEEVELWADGGGKVKGAATQPLAGRAAVAEFTLAVALRFSEPGNRAEIREVNGQPALVFYAREQVSFVLTIEADHDCIQALRGIANPEKLTRL